MKILQVYSQRPEARVFFAPIGRLLDWEFKQSALAHVIQDIKSLPSDAFIYLEIPQDPVEQKKLKKSLEKQPHGYWGLWDPEGLVEDPSLWFFAGAVDYIGPRLTCLSVPRFQKVLDWAGHEAEVPELPAEYFWEEVIDNREYDFTLVLLQLDEPELIKKKIGELRFTAFLRDWKILTERLARDKGGRLWMDASTATLFLFPPGKDRISAFYFAFQVLIQRDLMSMENFQLQSPLNMKIAMHRGLTPYRKPGDTGTLVADSVNSIFHLGQKFAQSNAIYFTSTLLEDVPPNLIELTRSEGQYEGRQIYRLCRILS